MTDLEVLASLLRPAGGGIHTVSTGRAEQQALQRRLYRAATDLEIGARWRESLARVANARVAILAVPSDTRAGLVRGAAFGPGALRSALLKQIPDFPERAAHDENDDEGKENDDPQLLH